MVLLLFLFPLSLLFEKLLSLSGSADSFLSKCVDVDELSLFLVQYFTFLAFSLGFFLPISFGRFLPFPLEFLRQSRTL